MIDQEFGKDEFKEETVTEDVIPQSENKILIYILVAVVTLPVFLILKHVIPSFNWPVYLDSILLFILTSIGIYKLIISFKKVTYLFVALIVLFLLYGSFFGEYGIGRFITDYKTLIANMKESDAPISTLKEALTPDNTYKYQGIVDRVNFPETVKEKADKMANGFKFYAAKYSEYTDVIRCLSIFRETKKKWILIKDLEQYHAYANESVETLSGDTDDYAIMICAFVKSIGKQARIKKEDDVFHPEFCIGYKEDISTVKRLIKAKLFLNESRKQEVKFDMDAEGRIWLSLSFYGNFPGRATMPEGREAISSEIINLNYK